MIARIEIGAAAVTGIRSLGLRLADDFGTTDFGEAAWLALVLRLIPDSPQTFPRGKWATIQSIERQLGEAAREAAAEIVARFNLREESES